MARQKIVAVREGDATGFAYESEGIYYDEVIDGVPTLKDLANLCDQNAESINAHDFVGVHRLLSTLLAARVADDAYGIMKQIAELGGLHGMNGVCGGENAYSELGVSPPWRDWTLED
jgi:hypothetical protein